RQPLVPPGQVSELLREVIDAEDHAQRVVDVLGGVHRGSRRGGRTRREAAHDAVSCRKTITGSAGPFPGPGVPRRPGGNRVPGNPRPGASAPGPWAASVAAPDSPGRGGCPRPVAPHRGGRTPSRISRRTRCAPAFLPRRRAGPTPAGGGVP